MLHVETLNKRVQHIHEVELRRLHTHEQLKTIGIHNDACRSARIKFSFSL